MRAERLFENKWEIQTVTCFDQLFDEFFLHADGEWKLPDLLLCLQKSPLWNTFKTFQAFTHRRLPGSGVCYRFEGSHKIIMRKRTETQDSFQGSSPHVLSWCTNVCQCWTFSLTFGIKKGWKYCKHTLDVGFHSTDHNLSTCIFSLLN